MPITLLQHSYCTFVIILFGPFSRLFINLTMCVWALFPKTATILVFVEQAFGRMPVFTKWVIASSSKVILARSSRHSTTGAFTSGTFGSRWFSLTLLHERILRRIWWWTFSTLIDIVAETAIVSFHTLPVAFPIANNLQEFFVHAVLCPDSWPRRSSQNFHFWPQKILISNILLDTSLHHSFQSVIIRP